ncbi:MAG: hypothetical protein IRY95_06080, partial [Clostridia bacterium]|nr:hypothetical protein [Clostridia bacterium]
MLRTYDIPAEERARLFAHLALAWDGQWFLKVAYEFGVEASVRLNARVR